jgi:HD-like signal output (HDOD) protein
MASPLATLHLLVAENDPATLEAIVRVWEPAFPDGKFDLASDGPSALAALQRKPTTAIVVSAAFHQEHAEVLATAKTDFPDTARILLAEAGNPVPAASTLGLVHQILEHPCPPGQLRSTIDQIIRLRSLIQGEGLRQLIAGIDHLPGLPDLYLQISQELRSFDPSVGRILEKLRRDPSLCTKVLRLVNSSYFGLSQAVTDLDDAVNLLGVEMLQSLVLFSGVCDEAAQRGPLPFSYDDFSAHAISVGRVAQELSHILPVGSRARREAFTAGILHDIGKLILAMHRGEEYRAVLKEAVRTDCAPSIVERAVFGATHGEIGAYLLSLWGFPASLVEAAAFHAAPGRAESSEPNTLSVVYLADRLCRWNCSADDRLEAAAFDLAYLDSVGLTRMLDRCIALREEIGLMNA